MAKIRSMDPDDVFAYQTLKIVTIRDRRLGLLHYLLQLGIFIYIVVYTIIIQQRYLKTEVPFGTIRATLREPQPWIAAESLPYCSQNQAQYRGHANPVCGYMLGYDAVYPPAALDKIFCTTRIKDSYYPVAPNCSASLPLPTSIGCAPTTDPTAVNVSRYVVAGIEQYTVYMEHAVYGKLNDLTSTNANLKGSLLFGKGKPSIDVEPGKNRQGSGDIFTVKTLLDSADVPDLDVPSKFENGVNNLRNDGVLLLGIVEYSNRASHPSELKYSYDFYPLPGVDVVAQEPLQVVNGQYVQRSRHGIHFMFIITGTIGKFDFPTLLTSIVNGLVLLKVATTIVDLLLLYVMPEKLLYKKHKYEYTADFSDLRKQSSSQYYQHDGDKASSDFVS